MGLLGVEEAFSVYSLWNFLGFPQWFSGKESSRQCRRSRFNLCFNLSGQEDPLEKEIGTHSRILDNPMDRGAWWATVPSATKSWTQLSNGACIRACMHTSTQDLPWVPMHRFKELLIREGRRCRDKGEAAKKRQCSLGRGSWFHLKGHTQQYLSSFQN